MYILLLKELFVKGDDDRDIKNRSLAFKNNAPFINYITKINNILIDNAEDLDVVMPTYNLVDYNKNYRKTTVSLWNCCRDEPNIHPPNNYTANPITKSASFKYKSSITGKILDNNDDNDRNDNRKEIKM